MQVALTVEELAVRALQNEAYATALAHGWWAHPPDIPEALALAQVELAEAFIAWQENDRLFHFVDGKPDGFASELADVIVYCLSIAGAAGVDVAQALMHKMAWNAGRSSRPRGLRHNGRGGHDHATTL